MKIKKHKGLTYNKKELKDFFSFHTFLGKNVIFLSKDGNSCILSFFQYLLFKLNFFTRNIDNLLKSLYGETEELRLEVKPTFFIIELTNNCNLRCKYCFRGEHKNEIMSNTMLNAVVDQISSYVKENRIEHFTIQPWGGEPLLEIDKIVLIRKLFKKKNLYPKISCETNGLLLTEKNLKLLFENNVQVGISLDGHPEINDNHRPLPNNGKSSNIIENNIRVAHEKYPLLSFGGISVISKDSLESLPKIMEYLNKNLGIKYSKFNILKPNPYISSGIDSPNENEIIKLYTDVFKYMKQNVDFMEGNVVTRYRNILHNENNDICLSRGCRGGYAMVAYDTNGNIFNCEMIGNEEQKLGTYKDDIIQSIKKSIANKNPYFNVRHKKECDECPWHPFCRGGCTSFRLNRNTEVDEEGCIINKTIYPMIIKSIATNDKLYNVLRKKR